MTDLASPTFEVVDETLHTQLVSERYSLTKPLDAPESIAEVARDLLMARNRWTRSSILKAILNILPAEKELILEILNSLEKIGDLLIGNRGQLAGTPIRIVTVNNDIALILSGMPTNQIQHLLGVKILYKGLIRWTDSWSEKSFKALDELEGQVITLETWAGLESSPRADSQFLEILERGLLTAQQISSLGHIFGDDSKIEFYSPEIHNSVQNFRWNKTLPKEQSLLLIRSKTSFGYWLYAIASKESIGWKWQSIDRDKARRICYALDRVQEHATQIIRHILPDHVVLKLDNALPFSEYRYLLSASQSVHTDRFPIRFICSYTTAEKSVNMLTRRLGVTILNNKFRATKK